MVLLAPFTETEFKGALFDMHPDKASGPDGLNPGFFMRFWDNCGRDIYQAALNWLESGAIPPQISETNITLIPKCDSPSSMQELRPISLCNVTYRILAKLLANRLRPLLSKCVSIE